MRAADNGSCGNRKTVVFLNYDRIQKVKGRAAVKEYREICDLVNHVSQIPVRYFTQDRKMIFSCPRLKREEDFLQTDTELVALMFAHCEKVRYPILFSTDLNESLAVVPELSGGQLAGAYIIGPILTSEVTQESIIQYAGEKDLPLQYTYALVKKYQSIPVMSMDRFGALPKLVYYYIYQKALDTSNMTLVSGTEEISRSIIVSAISDAAMESEVVQQFSRGAFLYKDSIEDFIRQGEPDALKEFIAVTDPCRILALSRKDPLRQSKYQFIYYLSMAVGAAIEGGVSAEKIYALGEFYSQRMEVMTHLVDVDALRLQMLLDMAGQVRENREQTSSLIAKMCCEYIADHIYGAISVSDLAAYTGVSCNYLSTLFHKDKGETITNYIQRQKIREAKRLLKHTAQPLLEISERLGFHSQSYFCTIFKKYSGMTPTQYALSQKGYEKIEKPVE